jgi:hypothetical protein
MPLILIGLFSVISETANCFLCTMFHFTGILVKNPNLLSCLVRYFIQNKFCLKFINKILLVIKPPGKILSSAARTKRFSIMTKPVRPELRSLLMQKSGLGFQKPSHNRPSSHLIQNVRSDRSQRSVFHVSDVTI